MSKMLEATCSAGVVTSEGVPVTVAEILSEGVGASEGVLFLDEDTAKYIAKTSPDLKTALTRIVSILSELTVALSLIDSKVQATTCPAGPGTTVALAVATANISQITSIQAQLSTLKESLR
jgi:hypothetical protein